jgi:hypothetical protein
MLHIFAKGEQDDLTLQQVRQLRREMKREFGFTRIGSTN